MPFGWGLWGREFGGRRGLGASAAVATEFYVSPAGSDAGAGTADQPWATLTRARDAVRALKTQGPLTEAVRVHVADGVYRITEPLVLTPDEESLEGAVKAVERMAAEEEAKAQLEAQKEAERQAKAERAAARAPDSVVESVVKSAARSASSSIGRQIGNTIVRGILGGIFGGSTSKKKSSWF